MAPPARAKPSASSRMPVSAVASRTTIITGARRSSAAPFAMRCSATVAASVAVKVAPSGAEGKRTAQSDERSGDRGRDEGRGKTVGEPWVQRGEQSEGREGQTIGDRHDARGDAGEDVSGLREDASGETGLGLAPAPSLASISNCFCKSLRLRRLRLLHGRHCGD
jgi:hypothetical protein